MNVYEAQKKLFMLHAAVKGYPEIKMKVKMATNLDPWGPTKEQLDEITEASNLFEEKRLIMKALWKRITTSTTKEWPHIYKALAVFEHLLLHGPDSIADEIKEQMYNLRTLHDFQSIDEKGVDRGHAIREKSKKLVEWVTTPSILAEERAKSTALKNKYVGISSEAASASTYKSERKSSVDNSPSESQTRDSRHQTAALERIEREREAATSSSSTSGSGMRSLTPPSELAQVKASAGAAAPKPAAPKPAPTIQPAAAPKPKPAPAPAPEPEPDPFDPFAEMAPKKPEPPKASDITDFFSAPAPAAPAPVAAKPAPAVATSSSAFGGGDDDLFANASAFGAPAPAAKPAPAPAPVEDDLFGAPPPSMATPAAPQAAPAASSASASDDFFSNDNPFGVTSQPAQPAAPAQPEKKSLFEDNTFGALANMDMLSGKPAKPAAGATGAAAKPGGGMSLKAMKQAQGPPAPMMQQQQQWPQQQQQQNPNAFNPFM